MELLIHIHAQFIIHNRSTSNYNVQLFDKDVVTDDFLAEQKLKADGKVNFQIDPSAYRDADSLREMDPDFYMVVLKDQEEIFRTPVANNVKLDREAYFNAQEGLAVDLGTFLIDAAAE